jgi:hypothetical protein
MRRAGKQGILNFEELLKFFANINSTIHSPYLPSHIQENYNMFFSYLEKPSGKIVQLSPNTVF